MTVWRLTRVVMGITTVSALALALSGILGVCLLIAVSDRAHAVRGA